MMAWFNNYAFSLRKVTTYLINKKEKMNISFIFFMLKNRFCFLLNWLCINSIYYLCSFVIVYSVTSLVRLMAFGGKSGMLMFFWLGCLES